MRLFIAINLSPEMKNALTTAQRAMYHRGVRGNFTPEENLHLTLAFIGEMKEPEKVAAALQTLKFKPFRLTLDNMGCFGDILWVGVKGNQGLTGAVRGVRDALENAQIRYDTQKFVPHITLIRKMSGNWKQVSAPKGEMMVKGISLMKSEQKDGRTVYTQIATSQWK